jgi:hypothetical protein
VGDQDVRVRCCVFGRPPAVHRPSGQRRDPRNAQPSRGGARMDHAVYDHHAVWRATRDHAEGPRDQVVGLTASVYMHHEHSQLEQLERVLGSKVEPTHPGSVHHRGHHERHAGGALGPSKTERIETETAGRECIFMSPLRSRRR